MSIKLRELNKNKDKLSIKQRLEDQELLSVRDFKALKFGDKYKSQGMNSLSGKKLCRSNAYEQTNFMDERMEITR